MIFSLKFIWIPIAISVSLYIAGEYGMGLLPNHAWKWLAFVVPFVIILFATARRARTLLEPKIVVHFGNDRVFRQTEPVTQSDGNTDGTVDYLRIGIRSDCAQVIDGLEVTLANLVYEDGKTVDLNYLLPPEHHDRPGPPRIPLNPYAIKYYEVAKFWKTSEENPHISVQNPRRGLEIIGLVKCRIKLKVGASTMPEVPFYIEACVTENDDLIFKLENTINVARQIPKP